MFRIIVALFSLLSLVLAGPTEYDQVHTWMPRNYCNDPVSKYLVPGGQDLVSDLVVGRKKASTEVVPARVRTSTLKARYNGQNHAGTTSRDYDFLVAPEGVTFGWIPSKNGLSEPGAVAAGTDADGESVIVCRGNTTSGLIIGSLYPSKGLCYIWPENTSKVLLSDYEVLVSN
nr:uncharacterized protein LOC108132614 [Drosophila bipectinata]